MASPESRPKQVAVFGATGRTGRRIVELAVERGNRVSALVRSASRLGDLASRVEVVEGDVLDAAAVDRAVQGADAVLSALGHVKGSPHDLETAAIEKIIASMRKNDVRRLIVLSSSVVGDPADKPTTGQSLASWLVRTFRGEVYKDSLEKARVVQGSDLDWTIVRASILTDGPSTANSRVGLMNAGTGVRVSRGDVAEFMLRCALEGRYVRERPYISA